MKRTFAWIGIIAIVLGFVALVYFTATGASANVIMATLFSMFVIPVMIYAFLMISKWTGKNSEDSKSQK